MSVSTMNFVFFGNVSTTVAHRYPYPSSPSHCACNALLVARPVPEAMRYLVDVLANLPVGPISWWHTAYSMLELDPCIPRNWEQSWYNLSIISWNTWLSPKHKATGADAWFFSAPPPHHFHPLWLKRDDTLLENPALDQFDGVASGEATGHGAHGCVLDQRWPLHAAEGSEAADGVLGHPGGVHQRWPLVKWA